MPLLDSPARVDSAIVAAKSPAQDQQPRRAQHRRVRAAAGGWSLV